MIRALAALAMFAAPAAVLGQGPGGTPGSSAADSAVLPYRRILAPADRKQDWPFRDERYLPIPAAEFNQATEQLPGVASPPEVTVLHEARLRATFDGVDTLSGTIELAFRPPNDQPLLVNLNAVDFSLRDAAWQNAKRPAIVGTTTDGSVSIWVERADVLTAQWTLRGRVDPAGGVNLDIVSFAAASSVLSLPLPADFVVQVDGSELAPDVVPAKGAATFTLRGLSQRRRLRIVPRNRVGVAARPTAVRPDVDYEYSERGIDVTAQFRIDAVHEPLSRVEVELDPSLTVVDVRSGERRLAWTDVATAKPPARRIALEFNPPLFGVGRTVMLRALAPAPVGKRHTLPLVRCPDLDWRQGTMSLSVSTPLVVSRIDPVQCAVAAPTPIAGERTGEVVEFTCFDARATARILVARAPDSVEATSVTAVTFAGDELTADYRAELRIAAGERFLIQAGVPTQWIIDNVNSVPAGAIADWSVSPVRDQRRWLTIYLHQSLRPERPLRLQINARAPRLDAGSLLKQDDLRIVEFRDARDDAPAAAVRSTGPLRVELEQERDESALAAERLDPLRRELLGEFNPEFLVDLRAAAEPWRIRVSRRSARLAAAIDVTALVTPSGLEEHYRLNVRNLDDVPLERLQVQFQPGRTAPLSWRSGDARIRFDARRLPATTAKPLETWELILADPATDSFDFHAVRSTPVQDHYDVALAAVVDADVQQGTISLESDAADVVLDRTSLTPTVVEGPANRGTLVRGRFDYAPVQDVAPEVPARLAVRRTAAGDSPRAVVWSARIHARHDLPDRIRNSLELNVQSLGAKSFTWRFPSDAQRLTVHVDQAEIAVRSPVVEVPLAIDAGRPTTVVAEYDLEVPAESVLQSTTAPSLDLDLPVLYVRRSIDLPIDVTPVDRAPDGIADAFSTGLRRWLATIPAFGVAQRPAAGPSSRNDTSLAASTDRSQLSDGETVRTVRNETLYALEFLALAVGLTVCFRWFYRRPKAFWFSSAALGAAAVSLPYLAAQLCFWVLLGVLLAKLSEAVLPRAVRRNRGASNLSDRSHAGSSLRAAVTTTTSLIVAVTLLVDATAVAQDAAPEPVPAVFIPVDERGRETGERYLVPERLWKALSNVGAKRRARGESLLLSSEYTLHLTHDAVRKTSFASEVAAKWSVKTFAEPAEYSIPFRPFADAVPTVLVDGRPVPTVVDAGGTRIVVAIETAGDHAIEAVARAPSPTAVSASRFELAIPRSLNDTVHCVAPSEVTGIALAEGIGSGTISADRRTTTFQALPGESLHFSWSASPIAVERPQFEQYELWRIRPGSVTVDVKLRLTTKGPPGRELSFYADPRLQWLARRTGEERGLITSTPVIVEQATIGQRLRWTLPEGIDADDVPEASFLLSGATGIGRMRLPELRMEGETAGKRLIAYAIDPALSYAVSGSKGFSSYAIPEFERGWGSLSSLPQAAFVYTGPTDDFSLALRPAATTINAASHQTLICGLKRIEVVFDADLDVVGDGVTTLEVQVPTSVDIDAISVVDADGEEQLLRWSRDDAGSAIVFLRSQVRGRHRLQLRGRSQVPTPGNLPVPILAVAGATGERRIRLARLPDAAVTAVKAVQLDVVEEESLADAEGRGRIERVLRVSGPKPAAELQIRGNSPVVEAQVVSTLRRDVTRWESELVARMQVRSGVLDEIRLDLPPTIATPLTVSPAMPYEVSNLRDGRRRLVLHPRDAIRGDFQFAIRSPLTALDREHPVPFVRFRQVESAEYYLQLPAQSGVNRVDWELEQLLAAESPAGFSKPTAEEVLTFRAVGPRPSAVLRDVRRTVERPQVRLADYRVRVTEQGEFGVATFLVEPSGQEAYVLNLPDHVVPLAVRAGGADVAVAGGERNVALTAPTSRFPHLVEVLFRRTQAEPRECDFRTLAVPSLVELPVVRTIWTVETAGSLGAWRLDDEGTATEQNVAQARSAAYEEIAADVSADSGLSVGAAWAEAMNDRRLQAQQDAERLTAKPTAADVRPKSSTASTNERHGFDEVWLRERIPNVVRTYVTASGKHDEVRMLPESTIAATAARRLMLPFAFFFLAAVGYSFTKNDALYRWSPHLCALLGIAALAFLQSQSVGWVLVATAVACRLHPSLRSARDRRMTAPAAMRLAR